MLSVYSSDMKYAFVTKKRRMKSDDERLLKRPRGWTDWYYETQWGLCATFFAGLLLVLGALQFVFIPWFFWQFQSFCKVKWDFANNDCNIIQDTIMHQIETWGIDAQCWGVNVEGCKYKLLSVKPGTLHAQHTTNYTSGIDVQDLIFRFTQEQTHCTVEASAISLPNLGTLSMDTGNNYCALRNLPRANNLLMSESASRHECPWRLTANCLFETGALVYKPQPHTQSIYENGRLISSMVVEGEDLDVNVLTPTDEWQNNDNSETRFLSTL